VKIFIRQEEQSFRLWCSDQRMSDAPCGPRLFRAPPIPDIAFTHDNQLVAIRDAERLMKYIADNHTERDKRGKYQA
jgi:hypothetical protein